MPGPSSPYSNPSVVPFHTSILEVLLRPIESAQYASAKLEFGGRLEEVGIVSSMGRVGSALDNAVSESFVATLKVELVHACRFPTRQAARSAIFEYLEAFYNRRRLHSSLGYASPEGFEDLGTEEVAVA